MTGGEYASLSSTDSLTVAFTSRYFWDGGATVLLGAFIAAFDSSHPVVVGDFFVRGTGGSG
jgi:hypothetical protein